MSWRIGYLKAWLRPTLKMRLRFGMANSINTHYFIREYNELEDRISKSLAQTNLKNVPGFQAVSISKFSR